VPDAAGLELIRAEINEKHDAAVIDTSHDRGQGALIADPGQVLDILRWLRDTPGQEYRFLSSLHAADYLPAEPRFGVHYELLCRDRVERIRVKALLADPAAAQLAEVGAAGGSSRKAQADGDAGTPPQKAQSSLGGAPAPLPTPSEQTLPEIDSCVDLFRTADFQEREAFDMFGILFRGHPDLRRILMPEDYVGWPQRRDFPMGGEPVLFTKDEPDSPSGWPK